MKKHEEELQLKRRVPSLREYTYEPRRPKVKIFNNGETSIAYRTIDELDAYGKIVLRFEENFEDEVKSFYRYGVDGLIFN